MPYWAGRIEDEDVDEAEGGDALGQAEGHHVGGDGEHIGAVQAEQDSRHTPIWRDPEPGRRVGCLGQERDRRHRPAHLAQRDQRLRSERTGLPSSITSRGIGFQGAPVGEPVPR